MVKALTYLLRQMVLIETSWNVKRMQSAGKNVILSVLIETSWNVKVFASVTFVDA